MEIAAEENMTPGHIAREMEIIPQRLNDLTNRFWGISAGEMIRRIQTGVPLEERA